MSSKQSQQLLDTIDAVLAECSKDPRRRAAPRPQPTRPAWRPRWAEDAQSGDRYGRNDEAQSSAS
jgi:hypothetical protein